MKKTIENINNIDNYSKPFNEYDFSKEYPGISKQKNKISHDIMKLINIFKKYGRSTIHLIRMNLENLNKNKHFPS